MDRAASIVLALEILDGCLGRNVCQLVQQDIIVTALWTSHLMSCSGQTHSRKLPEREARAHRRQPLFKGIHTSFLARQGPRALCTEPGCARRLASVFIGGGGRAQTRLPPPPPLAPFE